MSLDLIFQWLLTLTIGFIIGRHSIKKRKREKMKNGTSQYEMP